MKPSPQRSLEPSLPVSYFQSVAALFEQAAHAGGGCVERYFTIAGFPVRLRFAGTALTLSMTGALQHLSTPEQHQPAFTINLWDTASTGVAMPPPPWNPEALLARGVIDGYNDHRIYTAFQHGSSAVSLLDNVRDVGIFWVPSAEQLVYWEKGAPLRALLHWWLANHNRQLVHAAAIGDGESGVLIVGKGGSGKSTTALTCLHGGLSYAGDDYAVIGLDATPTVYSLYNSAKLDSNHLQRFPHLVPQISNRNRLDQEKALLFVSNHYPDCVARQFQVSAILVPRLTGKIETTISPISTALALRSLAPSTIFQLPRAGNETFKFLAEFVKGIPCYSLELGTDLSQIPLTIKQLLQERRNR